MKNEKKKKIKYKTHKQAQGDAYMDETRSAHSTLYTYI